ncbi:ATP-binding protein [Pseudonocardia sichuanensis]
MDTGNETRSAALHWHLPPAPAAVGLVRRRLDAALRERDVPDEAHEAVLLVANELAANAVEHGEGSVDVDATFSDDSVRIAVRDASADPPRLRSPSPSSLRGRGLLVVDSLATRWNWSTDGAGKTVWAEVPTDRALDGAAQRP